MPAQRKRHQSRWLTVAGLIAVTAATLLMMAWAIFPTPRSPVARVRGTGTASTERWRARLDRPRRLPLDIQRQRERRPAGPDDQRRRPCWLDGSSSGGCTVSLHDERIAVRDPWTTSRRTFATVRGNSDGPTHDTVLTVSGCDEGQHHDHDHHDHDHHDCRPRPPRLPTTTTTVPTTTTTTADHDHHGSDHHDHGADHHDHGADHHHHGSDDHHDAPGGGGATTHAEFDDHHVRPANRRADDGAQIDHHERDRGAPTTVRPGKLAFTGHRGRRADRSHRPDADDERLGPVVGGLATTPPRRLRGRGLTARRLGGRTSERPPGNPGVFRVPRS